MSTQKGTKKDNLVDIKDLYDYKCSAKERRWLIKHFFIYMELSNTEGTAEPRGTLSPPFCDTLFQSQPVSNRSPKWSTWCGNYL